jgi:hypothetical protein
MYNDTTPSYSSRSNSFRTWMPMFVPAPRPHAHSVCKRTCYRGEWCRHVISRSQVWAWSERVIDVTPLSGVTSHQRERVGIA